MIAPLLIIQRVAQGSALTGHTITTGHTSLFNVKNRGEMTESGVAVKTTADSHPVDDEA